MNMRNLLGDLAYGNSATAILRLAMGCAFLLSGGLSVLDPAAFGGAVARYGLLPQSLVPYAAVFLPCLEIIIGACLAVGYRTRAASLLGAMLMAAFIAAVSFALASGKSFDCGCFDLKRIGIGIDETIGPGVIARNVIFLAVLIMVFRARRHVLSLESYRERVNLTNLS